MGNSNYNSFEASLRHSSRRLEFLVGYTYGKSLDQSSSLSEAVNPLNAKLSRALSGFDLRHHLVASYNWRMPVEILARRNNQITSGGALPGITRFSSGLPVTLYTPGNLSVNTDPRNFDVALLKTVRISEAHSLDLRFEAFNVFNHAHSLALRR
jgi:hypothetical protein